MQYSNQLYDELWVKIPRAEPSHNPTGSPDYCSMHIRCEVIIVNLLLLSLLVVTVVAVVVVVVANYITMLDPLAHCGSIEGSCLKLGEPDNRIQCITISRTVRYQW